MKVLDLFSGIGGFSLGLERAGMETIAFCEFDEHAQKVLRKHWPDVPIHSDVRSLNGHDYRGTVDVVTGGFPCQDLSSAGKQEGFSGERSSLYTEMLRVISECMPQYAIFENVTGLITGDSGRWFGQFLYDLDKIGFDAEWHCIEAAYVGAPHRRNRVWVIAYPHSGRELKKKEIFTRGDTIISSTIKIKISANANSKRCKGFAKIAHDLKQQIEFMRSSEAVRKRFNLSQSPLCRANDGLPRRLDRLRRLGNAVVPQIPEAIGRAIMGAA
jgi:DNA (cytosine-5)-methyltransferase 1